MILHLHVMMYMYVRMCNHKHDIISTVLVIIFRDTCNLYQY